MPSVVISSWPTWLASCGDSSGRMTLGRLAERDLAAVVAQPLRVDAGAAHLARRVHVREERDRRHVVLDRRRQGRGHVAVGVDGCVAEPELLELREEQAQEVELLRRARILVGVLLGLRVDADVAEEALGGVLGELGGERRCGVGGHGASVRTARGVGSVAVE